MKRARKYRPEPRSFGISGTWALALLTKELWMAKQLGNPALFSGVCDDVVRKNRIRLEILRRGLDQTMAGNRNGKSETWAQVFARVYQEPLA